jgi:hypothetical protein
MQRIKSERIGKISWLCRPLNLRANLDGENQSFPPARFTPGRAAGHAIYGFAGT